MTADEKRTLKAMWPILDEVLSEGKDRGLLLATLVEKMSGAESHLEAINGRCEKRGEVIGGLQRFEATTVEALKHVAPATAQAKTDAIRGAVRTLVGWLLPILLFLAGGLATKLELFK